MNNKTRNSSFAVGRHNICIFWLILLLYYFEEIDKISGLQLLNSRHRSDDFNDITIMDRRDCFKKSLRVLGGVVSVSSTSIPGANAEDDERDAGSLPKPLRKYSRIIPLTSSSSFVQDKKEYNLPLEVMASRLAHDLSVGSQENGGYFISGDLSFSLFRNDCLFIDPTNSVNSLSRYQNALTKLFDPLESKVEVLGPLEVVENSAVDLNSSEIKARLRSSGTLLLPWRPYVEPYETEVTYRISKADGLIYEQSQVWNITAYDALKQTFSLRKSPPSQNKKEKTELELNSVDNLQTRDEISRVLYGMISRDTKKHPYTSLEMDKIDQLIDSLVQTNNDTTDLKLLAGTWKLVYLQPGPDGAGIDRRIPFLPEILDKSFHNQNFQKFAYFSSDDDKESAENKGYITNIGEVLGPSVQVRVRGTFEKEKESILQPRRFSAKINEGELCFGGKADANEGGTCISLPIEGVGLFDAVYIDSKLRIGQNINGGGARVVQIRI